MLKFKPTSTLITSSQTKSVLYPSTTSTHTWKARKEQIDHQQLQFGTIAKHTLFDERFLRVEKINKSLHSRPHIQGCTTSQ